MTTQITPELIRQEANKLLQRKAILGALGAGGAAAGVTFGARSLAALVSQANRNLYPKNYASPYASIVSLPSTPEPEEEQKKVADVKSSLLDFLKGQNATTVSGVPWAIPAVAAAVPTGAYAGYHFADWLADKQRMAALDSELDDEKKQFREALTTKKPQAKTKLAMAVCRLEELLEKHAARTGTAVKKAESLADLLGTYTGLYGAYAGTAGLVSGKAMFDAVRKNQRGAMLREALKKRRIMLSQTNPAPVVISDDSQEE